VLVARLLRPAGHTPNPLDYSTAWQLLQVLKALGKLPEDDSECEWGSRCMCLCVCVCWGGQRRGVGGRGGGATTWQLQCWVAKLPEDDKYVSGALCVGGGRGAGGGGVWGGGTTTWQLRCWVAKLPKMTQNVSGLRWLGGVEWGRGARKAAKQGLLHSFCSDRRPA
jgi:hypothetical protein